MTTTYKLILVVITTVFSSLLKAQTINWANFQNEKKNIIQPNIGIEHGLIYGLGYGHIIRNRFLPIIANVEVSIPSGNNLTDDYKVKIGGKIRWVKSGNIQLSTNIHGVFRSYQNDFVHLLNFGSDFSAVAGYYKAKWFIAGEVGFDKAIVTHFKHSASYKSQYPGVADGWYDPTTGGNFYYGLQTGYSMKKADITLRAGKMISQDFKTNPLVPFYAQLGYSIRF